MNKKYFFNFIFIFIFSFNFIFKSSLFFNDANCLRDYSFNGWNKSGTIVLYSHGFGSNSTGWSWLDNLGLINKKFHYPITFNYPEVLDFSKACLAQKNDLVCLESVMNNVVKHKEKNGNKKILGVGYSRGASALLNGLALASDNYKPMYSSIKNIDALILLAPFASVEGVVQHKINQVLGSLKENVFSFTLAKVVNYFGVVKKVCAKEYDQNGVEPIKVVDKISPNVPILLIHSKKDDICPINGSRLLYIKLKSQGRDNVYLLELEKGMHCQYFYYKSQVAIMKSVISEFYKKHDLKNSGLNNSVVDVDLKKYQPSVESVLKRISN